MKQFLAASLRAKPLSIVGIVTEPPHHAHLAASNLPIKSSNALYDAFRAIPNASHETLQGNVDLNQDNGRQKDYGGAEFWQ